MATIHVDGKQLEVNGADNLLQACLSLGLDIPYFCWHPALGSVGSCRQCAVKQFANADDKRGRLVMSCMTPSADNTYISIDDDEAKAFRASMIELLMTNHPHDCPVCEEGGHCHLQDMTVMSGHDTRRYRFTKRTHENQYLGPFIGHEMNRCIACYRCVRYYKDYAGGTDLGVYGSASNVYFGREKDGVLDSEFAGNLVEVCPTGVFTDKTHSERYNRKWDMQYAPSICQGCASGCNISAGERYGELRRIENRFNGDVNQYFLCDKGRFGYGFVNRTDRPKQPQQKITGELQAVSVDSALDQAIAHLKGKKILGIGSPRASLETNFALRELVGINQFSTGMTRQDQALVEKAATILQTEGIYTPTLREIESYDAVLILGEDITQTAARVALSVRQAAKNEALSMAEARRTQPWLAEPVKRIGQNVNSPVFILSVNETRLSDIAEGECVATPNDIARLGFAVAAALVGQSVQGMAAEAVEFAKQIAERLKAAKKPLIISGTSLQDPALLEAAAQIAQNLGAMAGLT
ncbi:MAG: NADH-quinone oxidoreductase subunit NuoG, partial [Flavobacteriales bacterium]